jgi:hypothetical protein
VATFETAREIQSLALLIEDEVIDRLEYVLDEIDKLGEAEDDQVKIAAEMTALTIDLLRLLVKYTRVDPDDRPTRAEVERFSNSMRAWRAAYSGA